jgi:hypothetical protein
MPDDVMVMFLEVASRHALDTLGAVRVGFAAQDPLKVFTAAQVVAILDETIEAYRADARL